MAKTNKDFAMNIDEIRALRAKHKAELSRHIEQIAADFRQHGVEAAIEVISLEIDSLGGPLKYAYDVDIAINI